MAKHHKKTKKDIKQEKELAEKIKKDEEVRRYLTYRNKVVENQEQTGISVLAAIILIVLLILMEFTGA